MYRTAAATAEEALVDYSLSDSGGVTLPPIDGRAATSATTARRRSALYRESYNAHGHLTPPVHSLTAIVYCLIGFLFPVKSVLPPPRARGTYNTRETQVYIFIHI